MKKEFKQTVQPQLRKKNGVWVKVLVPALCIVAGAGAMAGLVYGVPAVNNAFITNKDGTTTKPSGEVLDLKNQISELTTKLQNATTLADERGSKIAELNSQIEQIKADSALSEEQKQEQINSLTAQLNQAIIDKEQAESLVAGLQAQIEELQAKIDQMEGNAIIDTLQLENFVGTWYKNGTFEDYFTIEGTTITRGANEDKGVIYKLYNQVYLGLNSLQNTACELSENGTKITLADGTEYTKSFINTLENASINMGIIAGEYSYDTEKIVLNGDNTASYFDGTNTYHGAFTATATEKNVGGNITLTHYITLTLNKDSNQETMEFSLVNDNGILLGETKNFNGINIAETSENIKTIEVSGGASYYFVYRINETLTTSQLKFSAVFKQTNQASNGLNMGNTTVSKNGTEYSLNLTDYQNAKYLKIGINHHYSSYDSVTTLFGIVFNNVNLDLVRIEKVKNDEFLELSDNLKSKIIVSETYYKTCSTIFDYFTGTWNSDSLSINLTTEQATITPSGVEEPITATEFTVTAKTDGTNIIHTVTIKYTDAEELEHTLTFDITNNATTTTTAYLDEEELILNKA